MQTSVLRVVVAIVAAAFAFPAGAGAQRVKPAELSVTVVDESTGRPVEGATVTVSGVRGAAVTDSAGTARLPVVGPGTRLLGVARIGYARAQSLLEFPEGSAVEAEVLLLPQAVEIEGVRVTSWGRQMSLVRNGFYDRKRTGMGTYLEREEIERMRPMFITDIFRRVRGFSVIPKPKGGGYMVVSRRGTVEIGSRGFCFPLVFLDGIQVGSEFTDGELKGQAVLDLVPWETVEAVETYAGAASVPPQYNPTGSACGAILVWTR